MNYKLAIILSLALIARLTISLFLLTLPDAIQQDHYADYAMAIGRIESLPNFDTRLFPAYPILISLLTPLISSSIGSGIIISLLSSLISILILLKLTKSYLVAWVYSFFPPVWLILGSKVANEPLTSALMLASILAFLKNKVIILGILLGLAIQVRPISLCLLIIFAFIYISQRKILDTLKLIIPGILLFTALIIFNYFTFGRSNILYQFEIYQRAVPHTYIAVIDVLKDFARTIEIKQYRIFLSGLFYLAFTIAGLIGLFKLRKEKKLYNVFFWWSVLSLIFISVTSPIPVLESFARYTVPFISALVVGFIECLKMLVLRLRRKV